MRLPVEFVLKPDEMQYEESLYGDKVIIIPFDNRPVLDTEDDWVTVWSIFSETKVSGRCRQSARSSVFR